ncbi:MAG: hypothetical protein JWM21_1515 [Acidobacteria bacterium]|nr:hypothetical protein [Acidobacteriota bacterium]
MLPNSRLFLFLLLAAGCALLAACQRNASSSGVQGSNTSAAIPTNFSATDLAKLRWIEGTWRGTGDVENPFYERYRFESDSTLVVETFDNDKVDKVTDATRFELKDGQFGNGGSDSRWSATAIDGDSVTFAPVAKTRNSFRWKRVSKDLWQAILTWPAVDTKPARQRIYKMERWPPPK